MRLVYMLIALLVLYSIYLVAMTVGQDALVFPGATLEWGRADAGPPPGVERVWLTPAPDTRVEAWFERGRGVSDAAPGPAVMFFHGNATIIDDMLGVGDFYTDAGVSVLLVEFRGFARSTGRPSEAALVSDAVAFYDLLAARPEVDATRIILHGNSLGGGVAVQLAAQRPAAALVLDSTFSSIAAIAARFGVPAALCRHPFRSDQIVGRLRIPILIRHGNRDEVIPVSHARRLKRAAPSAELVITEDGHDRYQPDPAVTLEFLRRTGIVR